MHENDLELLEQFAADRDETAFAELFRRHGTMVRGVCRRMLADPGASDDAVQATFIVLAGHARTLARRPGRGDSVAGWLYRVAVNSALQLKRQAHARRQHEAAFAQMRQASGLSNETAEALSVLDEELNALPTRFQAPLVLCHLQGKTQQQAAHELGLTYATVRRRLDGAKRQLHSRLVRRGFALSTGAAAALWSQAAATATPPTPALLSTTVKSAGMAWHLADAPTSWTGALGTQLAGWGAKAAAASTAVKLKAAAALVVVASGALAATHFAGHWTAQADDVPATVVAAKPAAPRQVAAKREDPRRSTSPGAVRRMSPSSSSTSRSARGDQRSKTASAAASASTESFQAQVNGNGQVARFDNAADKQEALDLIRETMKDFPDLPAIPLVEDLLPPEGAPSEQEKPAAPQNADAKPERADQAPDGRAAKRKRASEERRNKTKRAAKPSRKKSTAKAGRSNVVELYGIAWPPSVERALAAAQGVVSDERDKPVFCLRVLGDLAGFM